MAVVAIHSFLVHPGKNKLNVPEPSGTHVPKAAGKLYSMLSGIYENSATECKIDISFNPDVNGQQKNERRASLLNYLATPGMKSGKVIAAGLQAVTTGKSGDGLLFLMAGKGNANRDRIVVSRFPADTGIMAELGAKGLDVQFVERIFMKNATAYKAVMYEGTSRDTHFWAGKAVDKQLNSTQTALSDYWIKDFLQSDFKTTGVQGSRRLAVAFRQASKAVESLEVKSELVSAASLLKKYSGKTTSPEAIAEEFGLSEAAVRAIKKELPAPHLYSESFKFDYSEFQALAAYRTDGLDNGALLTAPADEFDNIFAQKGVRRSDGVRKYATEGKLISQTLRKEQP